MRPDANLRGVNVAPLSWSLPVIFSTPQFISTNARPHTNHLTLRCRSNVIVSSRSLKGRGIETHLDTERVRFLRAVSQTAPGRPGHRTCRHYDRCARCIAVGAFDGAGNARILRIARSAAWAEPWH